MREDELRGENRQLRKGRGWEYEEEMKNKQNREVKEEDW